MKTRLNMTKKTTRVLGTLALGAAIVLELAASGAFAVLYESTIRLITGESPWEERNYLLYTEPNATASYYCEHDLDLRKSLSQARGTFESQKSYDKKMNRRRAALQENERLLRLQPDADRVKLIYLPYYDAVYFNAKDIDGFKKFKRELDETSVDRSWYDGEKRWKQSGAKDTLLACQIDELNCYYGDKTRLEALRNMARNRILQLEILDAIDRKDDAALEACVARFEENAIRDAAADETRFYYGFRKYLDPIDAYSPQMGQKAREELKKGYRASMRPLLAETIK